MRWFVRGDIDGFFGLALDNLIQLLVIVSLCGGLLGFDDALLYGHVMPGIAVSLLIGNLYYARQAKQLGELTGRSDVCALPYGINTVSLFAHVLFVMLPVKLATGDPRLAWQAGLVACLGSGLIELGGSFVAERIRRATPRAALLSTLAGIALTFISLGFLFRTYAHPLVGLATLGVILVVYFGGVRFKGRLPGGLVAVLLGTALAWATGLVPEREMPPAALHVPVPVFGDLVAGLRYFGPYLAIIIPMGLFNVFGSLQNIESAEAAGDAYETRPSLAVNGIGTLAAALFGSCFPTTIYIGHPGWKALGARAGYSIYNAVLMTVICLTGTVAHIAQAVPIDAGMAIVLWIGIVITAQAFQATPGRHAPAVVIGLLPGVAAWGTLLIKQSLQIAGVGMPGGKPLDETVLGAFAGRDIWLEGAFALEQGFIFTAMILSAATVAIIERRFRQAAVWCGIAAGLSALGFIHSYAIVGGDTVVSLLDPAWQWAAGYAVVALFLLSVPWTCERRDAVKSPESAGADSRPDPE